MISPCGDPPTPEDDAADAAPSEALEAELGALEALLPETRPRDVRTDAGDGDTGECGEEDAPE